MRPSIARIHEFQLREDTQVGISLLGLTYIADAAADLSDFIVAVRHIAERASRFRPTSPSAVDRLTVTSEEVRPQLMRPRIDDRALRRLGVLIHEEAGSLWRQFAGPDENGWSLDVNIEQARRYSSVHTIPEYLHVRDRSSPAWASPVVPLRRARARRASSAHPVAVAATAVTADLTVAEADTSPEKSRGVMVVHGRDSARQDLFVLLRALGLEPIEWSRAVKETGIAAPYNKQAVDAAFAAAHAAVILLAPEEQVLLREDLRDRQDRDDHRAAWQPRPNVLYEAGIAVTSHCDRTIVLELGRPRMPTDLAGVNTIRITAGPQWRHQLAQRLRDAGCPVKTEGDEWLTVGAFAEPDLGASVVASD